MVSDFLKMTWLVSSGSSAGMQARIHYALSFLLLAAVASWEAFPPSLCLSDSAQPQASESLLPPLWGTREHPIFEYQPRARYFICSLM